MILGIGKYKNYDTYLPECKEITEHLAAMTHDILETSKVDISAKSEKVTEIDLSNLLSALCEPYMLIAKSKGIIFYLDLSNSFSAALPPKMFEKVVEIIKEQLNLENAEIRMETSFKEDLDVDSLDLFELVMALEEEYDVEIPSEDLEQLTTVGEVVEYLKDKGAEG